MNSPVELLSGSQLNYQRRLIMADSTGNHSLYRLVKWFLASFFLAAAISKIFFPTQFTTDIIAYRILPYEGAHVAAVNLPVLELISGILLCFNSFTRLGLISISIMLSIFILAIVSVMVRGLPIGCGCFGRILEDNVATHSLVRDLALLALALLTYRHYLLASLVSASQGSKR
jgi:putative oxidoreductase